MYASHPHEVAITSGPMKTISAALLSKETGVT